MVVYILSFLSFILMCVTLQIQRVDPHTNYTQTDGPHKVDGRSPTKKRNGRESTVLLQLVYMVVFFSEFQSSC
jgi:hypothetical protein